MGLHNVNPEIIRSRYKRSFKLLPEALKIAEVAYIINNSDDFIVVAEKRFNTFEFNKPFSEGIEKILGTP